MYLSLENASVSNVRRYISEHFHPDDYGVPKSSFRNFRDKAAFIRDIFLHEKCNDDVSVTFAYGTQTAFCDWCSGLPSVLNIDYYCLNNASIILAQLMSNKDRELFCTENESIAEYRLSIIIYNAIMDAVS